MHKLRSELSWCGKNRSSQIKRCVDLWVEGSLNWSPLKFAKRAAQAAGGLSGQLSSCKGIDSYKQIAKKMNCAVNDGTDVCPIIKILRQSDRRCRLRISGRISKTLLMGCICFAVIE